MDAHTALTRKRAAVPGALLLPFLRTRVIRGFQELLRQPRILSINSLFCLLFLRRVSVTCNIRALTNVLIPDRKGVGLASSELSVPRKCLSYYAIKVP